jgi:hypothetical protein
MQVKNLPTVHSRLQTAHEPFDSGQTMRERAFYSMGASGGFADLKESGISERIYFF